ncbi:MAG: hypothetical protein LUE26_01145, partial [Alistipes sp.]|nr:hypothetical protein [Alistipes sp.]
EGEFFESNENPRTRAPLETTWFDWEDVYMPTGPGQPRIATPWDGTGSIVNNYGQEVAEDRKASEGWELLFSTFDPTDSSPLVNPYFILYNKYRGTNENILLYYHINFHLYKFTKQYIFNI